MDTTSASARKFPRSFIVFAGAAFLVLAFVSGLFIGREQGAREAVPKGEGELLNQGDLPEYLTKDVDFRKFWDVWNLLKETYYRQPLSDIDLYYGSVRGMVAAADDPYTVFFDPKDAESFRENLEGSFEGIGAEIGIKDEQLQIVAPLPNSPAERAGILPGDRIVLIEEKETSGMSVEEAVTLIRGAKGTTIKLTLSRDGLEEVFEVTITRDKIVIDSLKYEVDKNKIATISLYTFNEDTNRLFQEAVNKILKDDVKGIILDLRSNPGGLLTTAVNVAAAWTGPRPVVIESSQEGKSVFNGAGAARLEGIPTVVLVNGGSASGSEIVAGALQDYGLAIIVGEQTFGKGSVQDYRELEDGSAVKITIAEWLTPKERGIDKIGITPDHEVEYTIENAKAKTDPQKDKAVELILHPPTP